MSNDFWRKTSASRKALAAIVGLLAVCCLLLLSFKMANSMVYQGMRVDVTRTVKPGMSERQVYEALSHVGTFQVFFQGRGTCQIGKSVTSDIAWIRLRSDSWYLSSMELYLCFDDSGTLIDFREMFL